MIETPREEEWELETDRLLLSPIFATDADLLFELLKEPALYLFTGGTPPSSVQALEKRIHLWERRQSPAGDEVWLNWALRIKGERTVIGYVQATIKGSRAELAWVIGLPYQRQGYATEASRRVVSWLNQRLQISQLRAHIHRKHVASQKVASEIGLRPGSEITEEGEETWVSRP